MNKDCKLTGFNGGGWDDEAHMSLYPKNFNEGLAEFITNEIKPKSLLEFGSGLGYLSRYINEHCELQSLFCIEPNNIQGVYDNDDGPKLLPVNIFQDNHPHVINHKFDLVLSIEVAEHIERDKHEELFDFLVSHSNHWIIFSGARVGQGGHGHIAERPESEWKSEFLKRGMLFDEGLTKQIRLACDEKNINHRKNLMVFERRGRYWELDELEKLAKPYLNDILKIIQSKSQFLDGNLFYVNMQDAINGMPKDNLKEKRFNFARLVKDKTNILEIGFNAGHSILIALLINPHATIQIIDTCQHSYTIECFNYLDRMFPGRLNLIKGNSLEVISVLGDKKFDFIHYDGGKEKTIKADLENTYNLVKDKHVLLIDDTQNIELNNIVIELETNGLLNFDEYKSWTERLNKYKWKHIVATFNKQTEPTDTILILEKLQHIYDNKEFVSIYTNHSDVKKITGYKRAESLIQILKNVHLQDLKGDFVECGVAAGHSSVIAALALELIPNDTIDLFLYDTFNGFEFILPVEKDLNNKTIQEYDLSRYQSQHTSVMAVFEKVLKTGMQPARINMVEGMVENTVPKYLPESISVLRLDMDLYQPTKHCLEKMFPLLSGEGYLIIDDYGHWQGCKKAVDEFFIENNLDIDELKCIDYTCRVYRKI